MDANISTTQIRSPANVIWSIFSPHNRSIKPIILLFLTLILTFTLTYAAQAAEETHSSVIPMKKTDWNNTMTVPQFDPAQGVLERIELVLTGRIEGSVQVESLDKQPSTIIVSMLGNIALQRPSGSGLLTATPQTTRSVNVAAFDTIIDFAGTSGATFSRLIAEDITDAAVLTSPADLALFSGMGTLSLTVDTQGRVNGSGAGNLALKYSTLAQAHLAVKYIYQATADPAIHLKKYTNGEDADELTGPLIQTGGPVTWTYVVRNTGDIRLVEVTLVDDHEGAIACPQTELEIGASMTCVATGIASLGQYANVAVVAGVTPADSINPGQTVTDTDPSHYYGVSVSVCPINEGGSLVLPTVQSLGEGPGRYVLPDGFDHFIVKRFHPFRFEALSGEDNGTGQKSYRSTRTRADSLERVWACKGNCPSASHLHELVSMGHLPAGVTLSALVIDDDNDNRHNSWVMNGEISQPYLTIENQMMVEYLVLDVPSEADWGFYATDSVGLVDMCVAPTAALHAANIFGNGQAAGQNDNPTVDNSVFLPLITK
jgi:hypothetical protein